MIPRGAGWVRVGRQPYNVATAHTLSFPSVKPPLNIWHACVSAPRQRHVENFSALLNCQQSNQLLSGGRATLDYNLFLDLRAWTVGENLLCVCTIGKVHVAHAYIPWYQVTQEKSQTPAHARPSLSHNLRIRNKCGEGCMHHHL